MSDLPGKAIHDYHFSNMSSKLYVHDTFGPKTEMPVSYYFRSLIKMPELEQQAIAHCFGKILDIGAAAGSHALQLIRNGREVVALDISPNSCEVMRDRGLQDVVCEDFFKYEGQKFDTLLLLMNGIGLCASLSGFRNFLNKAKTLLHAGGKIVFDSCDIAYMYEEIQMPEDHYYGEAKVRYEYNKEFTQWFQWLYIDSETMLNIASEEGWNSRILFEDNNNQYLAELTLE